MLGTGQRMRAIVASRAGGPEVLKIELRGIPKPRDREVLIKVAAAGVNGADLRERQGKYPVPAGAAPLNLFILFFIRGLRWCMYFCPQSCPLKII